MYASCRCCMMRIHNDDCQLRNLFAGAPESCTVKQLYTLLTSIEADHCDGLPLALCTACWQQFSDIGQFRDMCIATDRILRMRIKPEPPPQVGDAVVVGVDEQPEMLLANTTPDIDDHNDRYKVDCCNPPLNNNQKNDESRTNHSPSQSPVSSTSSSSISPAVSASIIRPRHHRRRSHRQKFQCDTCGRCFFRKYRIEAHLRTHLGLAPYACADCGAAFVRFPSLRTHRLRRHATGPVPQFRCEYAGCSKTYIEAQWLREHVRRIHLGQRRKGPGLVCETCGQPCVSASKLTEHMYQHKDPATWPHACDMCPKRFIAKGTLQTHRKRHMNIRNYACTLCEARTCTKAELELHMASHNKEPTEQCDRCAVKFTTKRGLMRHMKRVHEGHKPYACTSCGLTFGQKRTLVNHAMRHTGEKPHGCDICGRRFIQAVALKRHIRQMHPKHDVGPS